MRREGGRVEMNQMELSYQGRRTYLFVTSTVMICSHAHACCKRQKLGVEPGNEAMLTHVHIHPPMHAHTCLNLSTRLHVEKGTPGGILDHLVEVHTEETENGEENGVQSVKRLMHNQNFPSIRSASN